MLERDPFQADAYRGLQRVFEAKGENDRARLAAQVLATFDYATDVEAATADRIRSPNHYQPPSQPLGVAGYDKLMGWTDAPIMPTPGAVGNILQTIAERQGINAVGVDIGGATSSTYTLIQADVGTTITVVASYTDDYLTPESVTSAATAAVTKGQIQLPSGGSHTVPDGWRRQLDLGKLLAVRD